MLSKAIRLLYHRNPFLEAVPWLMLASAMRFYAFGAGGLAALIATAISNLAVFLAFLLAARRMIEWTGGATRLGHIDIRDQLALGQKILNRVLLLLIGMVALAFALGFKTTALYFLLGFDGIAFDQASKTGMVWSAFLAAMVYLMLIAAEQSGAPSLAGAIREFLARWRWMLPAIGLVALAHIALSFAQGHARYLLFLAWQQPFAPMPVMNIVYFTFVFGFASIRLWATLAILTFALRESYRRTQTARSNP